MSQSEQLPTEVQAVLDLNARALSQIESRVASFSVPHVSEDDMHHFEPVFNALIITERHVGRVADFPDLFLRNASSMAGHQLSSGDFEPDVYTLKRLEDLRTALTDRVDHSTSNADGVPEALSSLIIRYNSDYLQRLSSSRISMEYTANKIGAEEALVRSAKLAKYVGETAVIPVVRAGSVLFETILRSGDESVRSPRALNYFAGNLTSLARPSVY